MTLQPPSSTTHRNRAIAVHQSAKPSHRPPRFRPSHLALNGSVWSSAESMSLNLRKRERYVWSVWRREGKRKRGFTNGVSAIWHYLKVYCNLPKIKKIKKEEREKWIIESVALGFEEIVKWVWEWSFCLHLSPTHHWIMSEATAEIETRQQ